MEPLRMVEVPASDTALLERIGRLRVHAWASDVASFGDVGSWLDRHETRSLHWAVLSDGDPIAAARLGVYPDLGDVPDRILYEGIRGGPLPSPIAVLSRLVVAPAFRRRGTGRRLDLVRLETAERLGCRSVVAAPVGERRTLRLEELGFSRVGGKLGRTIEGPLSFEPRETFVVLRMISPSSRAGDRAYGLDSWPDQSSAEHGSFGAGPPPAE